MPRQLIRMTVEAYHDSWYVNGPSHNAWYTDTQFIREIIERQKLIKSLYVLVLSDETRVTVDGGCEIFIEQY